MNKRLNKYSLTDLYKSQSVRDIVWRCLCPEFEFQFEKLMKRGDVIESSLVKKAISKKFWIKELFIEFGFPMETLEDVKDCLEYLRELESPPQCCGDTVDPK